MLTLAGSDSRGRALGAQGGLGEADQRSRLDRHGSSAGCLDRGECDGVDDVIDQRASRQIVDGFVESLQHRTDAHDSGAALHGFIGGVAGVQIGKDKHVGVASDFRIRRFLFADAFDISRVVLQRAIDQDV